MTWTLEFQLVCCFVLVASVAPFQSVDQYKLNLGVAPHGPNLIATSHNLQNVQDMCEQALDRLANTWHSPETRMRRLAKPSYAFRLQDSPPKPVLQDLMQPPLASQMWKALLERVINGPWMDGAWHSTVVQPWSFQHLCYNYVRMVNGNVPPDAPSVCLPINTADIPAAGGKYHTRHYLCAHRDGYIMVNLGTDANGQPLTIPLHTILTFAFHGPPQTVPGHEGSDSDDSDDDDVSNMQRYQEVGHLCGNPWCVNYRHLVWCTHRENCNHAQH